ncbi:hypothetical protein GCM10027020_33980 [Nocardioides salsibiostraticola]
MATSCTSQEPTTDPTSGADPLSDTQSRLDDDGIAAIKASGAARLDLQDHSIEASEVGIEAGRMGPIIGTAGGPVIDLTLIGPQGEDTIETSVFGVQFDTDGSGLSVTWITSYESGEGLAALREERRRWGLREADLQFLAEEVELGGEFDRVLGPGVAETGLVMSTTAQFGQRDVVKFEVMLADGYYTPEALAQIERGEIPDLPR